nr:MAG TPA: hypothetical protein [Caudoviricetes sp.]
MIWKKRFSRKNVWRGWKSGTLLFSSIKARRVSQARISF